MQKRHFFIRFHWLLIFVTCLTVLFILNSCNNNDDRLEGYRVNDPIISFNKYYFTYDTKFNIYLYTTKGIDSLSVKDTVFIGVTEFNRSDGKPCPVNGSELNILIETASGDQEFFRLDSQINLWYPDNVTGYTKILPIKYSSEQYPSNGMLEINPNGDKISAEYHSWWNGHLVTDTLYFQP